MLLAHIGHVRRGAGGGAELQRIAERAHARLVAPEHQARHARPAGQVVALLEFEDVAIVLEHPRIELQPVGLQRLQEAAKPHRPHVADVFQRHAPVVAARIGRVVEGAVRHERPVHELGARVGAVLVLVEHVEHAEVAGGQHHAALVDTARQLVEIGVHLFAAAAQSPGLADKRARPVEHRVGARYLGQLAVGRPAQAVQLGERHALGHFRVEVKLRAAPQAQAKIERGAERVALGAVRRQAVGAGVGRAEGRLALPDIGGLAVEGIVLRGLGLHRCVAACPGLFLRQGGHGRHTGKAGQRQGHTRKASGKKQAWPHWGGWEATKQHEKSGERQRAQ